MNKIMQLINEDFSSLRNLEKNILYALNKGGDYKYRIYNVAFKQMKSNMFETRKKIAEILDEKTIKNPYKTEQISFNHKSTDNPKHKFILRLLELGLSSPEIVNLKVKDYKYGILDGRKKHYIPTFVQPLFEDFLKNKDQNDYMLKTNSNKKYSISSIQKIRKRASVRISNQ